MRDAKDAALGIGYPDSVAGLGLAAIGDVAGKEPGMAARRTVRGLAINFDQVQLVRPSR